MPETKHFGSDRPTTIMTGQKRQNFACDGPEMTKFRLRRAKNSQKRPETVRNNQKLSETVRNDPKQPETARNGPKGGRNVQKWPEIFAGPPDFLVPPPPMARNYIISPATDEKRQNFAKTIKTIPKTAVFSPCYTSKTSFQLIQALIN